MRITGPNGADLLVLGSYTDDADGHGRGVRTLWQSPSGELTAAGDHPLGSPSCVVWHPQLPIVYTASESSTGAVTALRISGNGALTPLGSRETGGAEPCHLAVSPDGRWLAVANYGGGSVALLALGSDGHVGQLSALVQHEGSGPVHDRQQEPHPHQVVWLDSERVQAVDLGTDQITMYRMSDGALVVHDIVGLPAGTGPRQLHYAPDHRTAYAVGELSNELLQMSVGADGRLTLDSGTPATRSSGRNLPAHFQLSSDGRFGYLSNRGADTIALFDLTGRRPQLRAEYDAGGRWPRQFLLVGDVLHAAIQFADLVTTFAVDHASGALSRQRLLRTGTPTWLAAQPD